MLTSMTRFIFVRNAGHQEIQTEVAECLVSKEKLSTWAVMP